MKKSVSERVFHQIKEGKCQARPKTYFIFCSCLWLFIGFFCFVLFTSLLILAFYLMDELKSFFAITNNPYFFSALIPVLFIFLGLFFAFLVFIFYRKSRPYCRHENWLLILMIILSALTLNLVFLKSEKTKKNLVFIDRGAKGLGIININDYWHKPKKGTLGGTVSDYYPGQKRIIIYSLKGEYWRVDLEKCRNDFFIKKEDLVKLIGKEKAGANKDFIGYYLWKWN